ncbi:hypothetical protein PIB30_104010, partial [Stylosanthes scabra]|nr:hypothetical protein [Stylosanthes scabra]
YPAWSKVTQGVTPWVPIPINDLECDSPRVSDLINTIVGEDTKINTQGKILKLEYFEWSGLGIGDQDTLEELGRTPSQSEVFTRTPTKKKDRGQWVDAARKSLQIRDNPTSVSDQVVSTREWDIVPNEEKGNNLYF